MLRVSVLLLFILILNSFLFLVQESLDNIGIEEGIATPTIFDQDNSLIASYGSNNQLNTANYTQELPNTDQGSITGEANIFTNVISVFKNWLLSIPGAKILKGMVTAMPSLLYSFVPFGFPVALAFIMSFIWYVLIIFLMVEWIRGII